LIAVLSEHESLTPLKIRAEIAKRCEALDKQFEGFHVAVQDFVYRVHQVRSFNPITTQMLNEAMLAPREAERLVRLLAEIKNRWNEALNPGASRQGAKQHFEQVDNRHSRNAFAKQNRSLCVTSRRSMTTR
jgi:hypothetical protein